MKKIFKILIAFLLASTIWLLCLSCGARKVNKEYLKEETKTELIDNSVTEKQTETNIKAETKLTVDNKNESVTQEESYEPIDPTKEASIIDSNGKKTILNNSKKIVKTEAKKNNTQSELLEKFDELKKEAQKEKKAVEQVNLSKKENSVKNVKKEQFNPFYLSLFLIPLLIIYIAYRKYKKLPINPF